MNVQIVQKYYEALERGDLTAAFDVIDVNCMVYEAESLPYGGTYQGYDGWQHLFSKYQKVWKNPQTLNLNYLDAGSQVIVLLRMRLQAANTGQEIEIPMAEVFKLQDGKIVELQPFYWDTAKMLQALQ